MINSIFRACSCYKALHESLQRAKTTLERNQHPKSFVDSIIRDSLNKLFEKERVESKEKEEEEDKKMLLIEYRGKISDQFKKFLISSSENNM